MVNHPNRTKAADGAPTDAGSFRAWREGMGWSQLRAAAELGLTTRMVSYYECGRGGKPQRVSRAVGLACNLLALAYGVRKL